jgi:ribonuclease HI
MKRNVIAKFDGGGGSDGTKKVYGVVIVDADTEEKLHVAYGLLPNADTFNVAEWAAAKTALGLCWLFRDDIAEVTIQGDSQVIVYQLTGQYNVNKSDFKPYYDASKSLEAKLQKAGVVVNYNWVRRHENKEADELGRLI